MSGGASRETVRLAVWLQDRQPPVPGEFGPWIEAERPDAPAGVDALARETGDALERALAPEGRPRGGAFDLLAADGFATWACEAALEDPDTEERLVELVRRFAS